MLGNLKMLGKPENVGQIQKCWENLKMLGESENDWRI
jgi:hypothetical protein